MYRTSRRAAVGTPTKGGVSFVTFIQIVSLLGQFKFEWPEGLKAFFGWFSVFKLNVAVARPECTTALMRNAVFKYYLQLLLPFVVGLALLLYFASAVFHAMLVKRASRWYRRVIPGMVRKAAALCQCASSVKNSRTFSRRPF